MFDVNIFLTIINKETETILEYRSEEKFDINMIKDLTEKRINKSIKHIV